MSKRWKYIFPALLGIFVYICMIAVNDTYARYGDWNRWARGWGPNAAEIGMSLGLGYVFTFIAIWWEKKNKTKHTTFSQKQIFKEFMQVYISSAILINVVGGGVSEMVDSYQWQDVILLNIIPVLVTLFFYAIIRGNYFIKESINKQVAIEKLHSEQLESELKFLKSQIHPHFLFNALNTIYFQMDESIKDAKNTIEKFAELLRYRLYDDGNEKTPVNKEFEYLLNYIELQKIRHSNKLKIEINIKKTKNEVEIYPFLMLPLIENAFKYVGGQMFININAEIIGDKLIFEISNTKEPDETLYRYKGGIGLANLKRRLDLLYPHNHELLINDTENKYIATLKVTV